jgi:hypothetical protein
MPSQLLDHARVLRHAGLDAVREVAWRTYLQRVPAGDADPVLDADWDLLVVLDACRADLFEEVVGGGDYEGLDDRRTRTSPGSSSTEWLSAVFGDADDAALESLAYVTGNPYSAGLLDGERFGWFEEVWRDGWDDDLGTVPPRPLTDRTVSLLREHDPERTVVHYMQPHFPSLADGDAGDEGIALAEFGDRPMSVWNEIRVGRRTVEDVWASYRRNLELVLADVQLLRENVDADRVVVTADHGNAFGERSLYGHPEGVDLPCLREVPWCVTTATDRGSHDPDVERTTAGPGVDADEEELVADRLRSLGYRE